MFTPGVTGGQCQVSGPESENGWPFNGLNKELKEHQKDRRDIDCVRGEKGSDKATYGGEYQITDWSNCVKAPSLACRKVVVPLLCASV